MPIDVQEECISKLVGRQAQIVEQCLVDNRRLPHLPLGIGSYFVEVKIKPLSGVDSKLEVKKLTNQKRSHFNHISLFESTRR